MSTPPNMGKNSYQSPEYDLSKLKRSNLLEISQKVSRRIPHNYPSEIIQAR